MSKVLALYHIVFGTKHRMTTIEPSHAEDLHRFICKAIEERKCYLYRINSMPDHVHILLNLSPSAALADVVGQIKANSSAWMMRSKLFPLFQGWCDGYYAASISYAHRDAVADYIKNQQIHHASIPYNDEIRTLYIKAGLTFHEQDFY